MSCLHGQLDKMTTIGRLNHLGGNGSISASDVGCLLIVCGAFRVDYLIKTRIKQDLLLTGRFSIHEWFYLYSDTIWLICFRHSFKTEKDVISLKSGSGYNKVGFMYLKDLLRCPYVSTAIGKGNYVAKQCNCKVKHHTTDMTTHLTTSVPLVVVKQITYVCHA